MPNIQRACLARHQLRAAGSPSEPSTSTSTNSKGEPSTSTSMNSTSAEALPRWGVSNSAPVQGSRKRRVIKQKAPAQVDAGVFTITNQNGTKMMSDNLQPTVLIQMVSRKFVRAYVHYVLITPYSGRSPGYRGASLGSIPALLMSDPVGPGRTTRRAELMPLMLHAKKGGGPAVMPLLLDDRFKQLFEDGTKYRLKVIAFGRSWSKIPGIDGEEEKAKLTLKKMIKDDVMRIPWKRIKKKSLEFDKERLNSWPSPSKQKLSSRIPSGRIQGLSAGPGERNFAAWFRRLPPDVHIDKSFKCDSGTLKRDNFQSPEMLFEYLKISPIL